MAELKNRELEAAVEAEVMGVTDYDESEAEEDYREYMWDIKRSWLEEYRNEKEKYGNISVELYLAKKMEEGFEDAIKHYNEQDNGPDPDTPKNVKHMMRGDAFAKYFKDHFTEESVLYERREGCFKHLIWDAYL